MFCDRDGGREPSSISTAKSVVDIDLLFFFGSEGDTSIPSSSSSCSTLSLPILFLDAAAAEYDGLLETFPPVPPLPAGLKRVEDAAAVDDDVGDLFGELRDRLTSSPCSCCASFSLRAFRLVLLLLVLKLMLLGLLMMMHGSFLAVEKRTHNHDHHPDDCSSSWGVVSQFEIPTDHHHNHQYDLNHRCHLVLYFFFLCFWVASFELLLLLLLHFLVLVALDVLSSVGRFLRWRDPLQNHLRRLRLCPIRFLHHHQLGVVAMGGDESVEEAMNPKQLMKEREQEKHEP